MAMLGSRTALSVLLRRGELVFPSAGCAGVVVLVLVTAMPGPASARLPAALTGMAVVVLAWLGLGRSRLSVSRLYWTAVAWCLPLVVAPPLFSGDVYSYQAQGIIAAKGIDPYRFGPLTALGADSPITQQVSRYWQDSPAPYGPVSLSISRAIARLVDTNIPATVLLNRCVELAGLVLIAWALPRLARRTGVAPESALWLGLLNPLVLWHVVAGTHYEGLMVGLILVGMELGLDGLSRPARLIAGVGLLSVAANIKVVAAAALLCLGVELIRQCGGTLRRGLAVVAGLLAGFVVVSIGIAALTDLGFGWLGTLDEPMRVHSWLAPTNQFGFLIEAFGGPDTTSTAIAVCVQLGALLGVILVGWLLVTTLRGQRHSLAALGLVFAAILVTGPVVQPWYLLWAIVPLSASPLAPRARHLVVAVSAVFAMVLPPVTGGVATLVEGYLVAAGLMAVLVGITRVGIAYAARRELSEIPE